MSKPFAFTFWQSSAPTPAYLELCFQTQSRNLTEHFELVQLDFESCKKWVPERDMLMSMCEPLVQGRSPSMESRRWSIFCDLLRVRLISMYGGIWVDADTLVFPQFSLLADLIPKYSLIASEQEGMKVANGIFAAKEGSLVLDAYYQKLSDHLEHKKSSGQAKARWGEYGFTMLSKLLADWQQDDIFIMPFGMVIPFDENSYTSIFGQSSLFERYIPVTALGLSFFNNYMTNDQRSISTRELLSADTIFSHAYKIAMAERPEEDEYLVLSNSSQLLALNRFSLVRDVAARREEMRVHNAINPGKRTMATRVRGKLARSLRAAKNKVLGGKPIFQANDSRKAVFSHIYERGVWDQGGSKSGCGSTLRQTVTLRQELPGFLHRLGVKTLLDVPCGDFNWMQHIDLKGIKYIGGDIVPEIIASNQKYSDPDHEFLVLDVVNDKLPSSDIVLCRDCYSHLPNEQVIESLDNIIRNNIDYLLVTHFPESGSNNNISVGDFRRINFENAPFGLPPPRDLLNEQHPNPEITDKCLALWHRDDLISAVASRPKVTQ